MSQHLYRRVLQHFGDAAQIQQTMAECGELITALSHYFASGRGTAADVATEIADVEIMCAQMRMIVGSELVDLEKVEKLAQLQALLADEEQRAI